MNQHIATPATRSIGMSTILAIAGASVIVLASQLSVHLPFTPVPITGQTFAVILWGLLFGSRQGASASAMYLSAGLLGLPVFADFTALTALVGPTSGYLLGFIPAAWLAGYLKESGFTQTYLGAVSASIIASLPIFLLGTIVLAAFVGYSNVWMMGVVPFLVGDVVKSAIAGVVVKSVSRKR